MRRTVGAVIAVLAIVMGSVSVASAALPPGGTFVDDDGSVHEADIEAIRAASITLGCDPVGDRYCPTAPVTRAEMATFLVRALGLTPLSLATPTFTDVSVGAWYYGFVERLAERQISVGYGDGRFGPDDLVTRGDMAVFLVRALGEQPVATFGGVFTDVPASAYYARHVERIAELEITIGCGTAPLRYCPNGAVSREEMASFLARAFDLPVEPVPARPSLAGVTLALAATGFSPPAGFDPRPVFVDAPVGDSRLFVVDQPGLIWIVSDGKTLTTPFLDIRSLVSSGGERGLLGLAFHPQYVDNGRFYVDYTDANGDTRVVEYQVSDDPSVADPASARQLLFVDQPASNHNGGMLAFGADGLLYVALGDGGGGGDTYRQGQRADTLLATITRVNVDSKATSLFAYGLRNPWRFSFDGRRAYIGDVGQGAWEEVDVLSTDQAGANLGWSIMEGAHCYGVSTCSTAGLVLPVVEYPHSGGACSVTGGYVYRGTAIPELAGHYLYGDFCAGWIKSFRYTGVASDARTWGISVSFLTSFGTDGFGEMYVTSTDGSVRKIVRG